MSKTKLLIVLISFTALLSVYLYFGKIPNHLGSQNPAQTGQNKEVSHEMQGVIKEVQASHIFVNGLVMSATPRSSYHANKTIEFAITPQTILQKTTIIIKAEQMKSSKPFHPETSFTIGKISDLVPKLRIVSIKSADNLFTTNNPTATEINYLTYDYPPLP